MDLNTPTKDDISELSLTSKRSTTKVPQINLMLFKEDSKPFIPGQDSQMIENLSSIYAQTDRNLNHISNDLEKQSIFSNSQLNDTSRQINEETKQFEQMNSTIDQHSEYYDYQNGETNQYIQRSFQKIKPYDYQVEIFGKIKDAWERSNPKKYGNIVYLETGMGKTHIATMLLNYLFSGTNYTENELLVPSSIEEIQSRSRARDQSYYSSSNQSSISQRQKKVFFIVPVQNLIEQQAATIERYTNLNVGRYLGRQKRNNKYYSELDAWREEFATHDVFVAMAKKFYDLLMHGFTKMEEIDMIVFDECHHTDQDHLYNLIMRDFFFHKFNPDDPSVHRPHILGLTASPIKSKIERVTANDIENMLQNLSNNLYSRFITISPDQIQSFEKDLNISIEDFEANFDLNLEAIEEIEAVVIRRLAQMVSLPEGSYKLQQDYNYNQRKQRREEQAKELMNLLNESTFTVAQQEQDTTVVQFLRGRRNLIELDCTITKQVVDLANLPTQADKVLLILCLIILKKVNSLLIELGPLAVKTFMMDLKHDLLKGGRDVLGEKRYQTVEIINNYCKTGDLNMSLGSIKSSQQSFDGSKYVGVSNKIKKLVEILKKSYKDNPKHKTIIFVKDRSVAVYLKKLLHGDQKDYAPMQRDLDQGYFEEQTNSSQLASGLLDTRTFRIGFAMGLKRMSLINQAYRSTNIKNTDIFKDVLNSIPSCSTIKLSQTQFKETLDKFNTGELNVLIATNVVEEGLDVSTCSLVICLNELATVKTFIQMKGRARQMNSRFVFLCAKEELQQVKDDQESFGKVIELMKLITLRGDNGKGVENKGELVPQPNICQVKQEDESSYLEEPRTGAKISMRDAKQLVEFFCLAYADTKIKIQSIKKVKEKASEGDSEKHLELKVNYVSNEASKDGVKFFYTVLYMPETCKHILRKVNPKTAFIKKKDAENHVALLAIIKLRNKGYLDDHLFPQIPGSEHQKIQQAWEVYSSSQESQITKLQFNSTMQSISQTSLQQNTTIKGIPTNKTLVYDGSEVIDLSQPRKKKHITDEQKSAAQQESKKFQQSLKNDMKVFEFDNSGSSLVNELKFNSKWQTLKVMVFRGKTKEFNYPFTTTRDFLGVICEQDNMCAPILEFSMYQETKQRDKNSEHLLNLMNRNLVSQKFRQISDQAQEELPVCLYNSDSFSLLDDMQHHQVDLKKETQIQIALHKLQFFHTWVFYYFYSADHKFYKAIIKNKYPFVNVLFSFELDLLRRRYLQVVKGVYGEKTANCLKNQTKAALQYKNHYAYTVPVNQTTNGFEVNWRLVERTVDYVKNQLLELALPTERHVVIEKYNLEDSTKSNPAKMINHVWDNRFGGNRHVVIEWESSLNFWNQPMDYLNSKSNDQKNFKERIKQEILEHQIAYGWSNNDSNKLKQIKSGNNQTINNSRSSYIESEFVITPKQSSSAQPSPSIKIDKDRKLVPLLLQEYQFIKQGSLQQQRFSRLVFKCRKERHFVDFASKRREEITELGRKQIFNTFDQNNLAQANKRVNTIFEITEQQLTLAPLSYNQYQVLQQSCFHLLNFNEFILIDKFIQQFFSQGTCLVEFNQDTGDYYPSECQKRLFSSHDQIWEDVQSSGKILRVKTQEQLKRKLQLIREALTAPSACRQYDYERLEFYGDSIIGFLVILELFLINQSNTEGDLDFLRIARVSNENFYKINKKNLFYEYMITEPHHIFQGFTPAGFEDFEKQNNSKLHYQNKITQKQYNELNNKMKELKKMQERLRVASAKDDDLKQMFLKGSFFNLVKIILKDAQMVKKISYSLTQHHSKIHDKDHLKDPNSKLKNDCRCQQYSKIFEKLMHRSDSISIMKAVKILMLAQLSPVRLLRYCIEVVSSKLGLQIQKQRETRDKKTAENERFARMKKRPVYYKQFADIVESVVGAVTISCGINLTQGFLKQLDILQCDQLGLKSEMERLQKTYKNKEQKLFTSFYVKYNLAEVEKLIGYTFSCKSYLVTALTHKSYIDQQIEQQLQMRLDDYERLEFLGDSILNYMVAKHFFLSTQEDIIKKMPKELHKMKTAVINNALLSLIVIEKGIHSFIIYNQKAESFRKQFEKFVNIVKEMVSNVSTIQLSQGTKDFRDSYALDLDELYEHNLKIFGDVFESIIGAVFLDCCDTERTWQVLEKLIMPYITVYADLESMQDHARTKLLELWNQRSYTKKFKCTHESQQVKDEIVLTAVLINNYDQRYKYVIFSETFPKDAKNKNRLFYKSFYSVVERFISEADEQGQDEERRLNQDQIQVVQGLQDMVHTLRIEQEEQQQYQYQMDQYHTYPQVEFNLNTESFIPHQQS